MKRTRLTIGLGLAVVMTILFTGIIPGFCASNFELEERIKKLERNTGGAGGDSPPGKISEWVTLSGAVEIEAGFTSRDSDDSSDISLATTELGIEAKPQDWVTGFMLLSWDDDESELLVDEAHITLGGTDNIPYYLSAGKIYVPFGAFETMMISDPITLDIGEIVDNAIQVGVNTNGFRASAYIYNGDVDEADNDDTIQSYGLAIGYATGNDAFSLDVGADWTSNILESGVLGDAIDGVALADYVPGYAIHAMFGFGPFSLIGEYVSMTDDAKAVGGATAVAELSAYAIEAGYTVDISGYETTFAVGYQASDSDNAESYSDFPESRFLTAIGVGITDNLSVACEYSRSENYSAADGGDDDETDAFTVQMAFEF